MVLPAQAVGFSVANPHALAAILDASETKSIIASRDIFDISGTKLWARDLPVSQALQRKLLDRQLRHPLESCLLVEDGISAHSLVQSLESMLVHDTPLTALLKPHADKIVHEAAHLPIHSVAQLLLTAGQSTRPHSFEHAVQAMALSGVLMLAHGGSTQDLRLAMLCGLLHDLGEMYIDPQYAEADSSGALDVQSYRQLVVHPHVGKLLIQQLTDYPPGIARAIAEHHERLDGSGYPHRLHDQQVSSLGTLLAVVDAALGVLRGENACWSRASIALRVVPGEYEQRWVGLIEDAARRQPTLQARLEVDEIQARLLRLEGTLQVAQDTVSSLLSITQSPSLHDALTLARHLLDRLEVGWNASGLGNTPSVAAQDAAEIEAVEDELLYRLGGIQRAALLHAGDLSDQESTLLSMLCNSLVHTAESRAAFA